MSTTEPLLELLAQAANVCALKQTAYSANVANASVPGYHRVEVDFDSELARLQASLSSDSMGFKDSLAKPTLVNTAQESVRLDQEMALMAKNAVRYQALLGAFERTTGLLRMAIHEGKEG